MNFYLTGFMGSGKTYWGKIWSKKFHLNFLDLDEKIEAERKRSINEIFKLDGEEAFRKVESEALRNTQSLQSTLIACGGGTPCFHHNMKRMNDTGITIYLKTDLAILLQRLAGEFNNRPLLKDVPKSRWESELSQLLSQREPFYLQSNYIFDSQEMNADSFLSLIGTLF